MFKLLHNWFAKSRRIEITVGNFNHCSSVCPHQDGVLIAWYAGSGECRDDQSVYVVYVNGDHQSIPLRIGDRTGNPVLIPSGREATLLWSHFEDDGPMRSIIDRWKYCSLRTMFINHQDGRIQLLGTSKQIVGSNHHLLGRCNPVMYRDQYLLPLYDEVGRQGVIFKGKGLDYEFIGRLGEDMIQPTIWVGRWKDRIHSLSRNFMNGTQFKSRQSYSDDGGETWSKPEPTSIPNRNSSLHVLLWHGHKLILWNNTPKTRRENMTLGILDGMETKSIAILDNYGAYPSMCIDNNDDLNMTYTSHDRVIVHHTWNYRHFKQQLKSSGI